MLRFDPTTITAAVLYAPPRQASIMNKIMGRCVWVDRGYKEGPCLEWQGPTSGSKGRGKDYPRFCLDGQTVAVHRCLWVCLNGYLPGKKQLDHLCRNRRCVLHCEPVTHKQNQKRRAAAAKEESTMATYQEAAQERIKETMPKIARAIREGAPVVDAINRNASDVDSYNHALAQYGLKPHVHD